MFVAPVTNSGFGTKNRIQQFTSARKEKHVAIRLSVKISLLGGANN